MNDLKEDSTSTATKESRIGKGYSYLFAIALTALIAGQSVNISLKNGKDGVEWAIAPRELNTQIFYPSVMLIAAIVGVPTDAIALAFGKFVSSEKFGAGVPPVEETFKEKAE